jgi:uncharacterized protein
MRKWAHKQVEDKMKIRKLVIAVIIIVAIILVAWFLLNQKQPEIYQFKGNTLNYAEERGQTNYEVLSEWENDSVIIKKIRFKSRPFQDQEIYIYGLLFLPGGKENAAGFVFLPAGDATKEARQKLLIELAKRGYASLAIDQRGVGETAGTFMWVDQDYLAFKQGDEPVQHLAIYDALRSFDVLRETKEIDKNKVGFIGESMGGRFAIIAAAIEKRSAGVIGISAAGFGISINPMQEGNNYLVSIDPDHYISKISPRYLMMLQGTNDTVVPLETAQTTFDKAGEPKDFYTFNCEHGYCEAMHDKLLEGLEKMLG